MLTRPNVRRRWGQIAAPVAMLLCVALAMRASGEFARHGASAAEPDKPAAAAADSAPADAEDTPTEFIASRSLIGLLRDGGVVMFPIFACSFVLVAFVFERAICLRRGRVIPGPFVKRFLHQLEEGDLDPDTALKLCQENDSPVAHVFAAAVKKWGRPAAEVEQAITDAGERAANGLRRYLRLLNGVSTISPLLGLLGTVFGMIRSFNTIASASAMGKPELLASGIAEALITTAAGLTVAIPALTFYLIFLGRVDQLVIQIDELGQQVTAVISAEGTRPTARAKATRASRQDMAA